MIYKIQNDHLTVAVRDKGAELWSVQSADGTEYLWQGDPKYWSDRALNLFPHVGLCTGDVYTYRGKRYHLDAHGFVKDMRLEVSKHTENQLVFSLTDTPETWKAYPFPFLYTISYTLLSQTIHVDISVQNRGAEALYFAVGGHPGFNVPMEENLSYEDYYLEFLEPAAPNRAECTDGACQMLDCVTPFPLEENRIPLTHQLFAERVLILQDMPKRICLRSNKGKRRVTVTYPDMKYLGLWKWIGTDAPYVCIEPWTSLPARDGIVEDLETQPDMTRLESGAQYQNHWTMTIE